MSCIPLQALLLQWFLEICAFSGQLNAPSVFLAEGKALLLLLCFSANSGCFIFQYLLEEPPPVGISLALIYMIN